MTDSVLIQKLNARLIDEGILDRTFEENYSIVYQKLNEEIFKIENPSLPEINFELGEKFLKNWLTGLSHQGISQDKLTNYLRCGLAHLSYEYIKSNDQEIEIDDKIESTIVFFKNRNFEKSFFRSNDKEKMAAPKSIPTQKAAGKKTIPKKKAIKKKKLIKKKISKKKASKKIQKKKTVKKKILKKKTKRK
ncbi:hypothetical protein GS518_10950 [Leptospira interrogans]|uniref:Uncharacterized protein n=3 Tax=Leptospira interrogans TaxID=173 RepID=Q72QA5_LEPIC|nr:MULTISPECIES: hypothetical protein [Leptospira]APH42029.1 Uncharacterized protein A9P81_2365 [Leptospira interrogans serovar Copenhageni/Icterohaemorrhagiae]AAS70779.1 conserved hypothetical protein [Leptospira interrogans serovar Copenhageni str. Fiocruz L1-130]AJR14934.1 hypothetical protein LIL_12332 [Leptospira interrogans serovar Linhai str. 56609]AKH77664.1 hypothetical protein BRAT_11805 [Leptospira interrogans serovar Bratislava]ARB94946.1 hypothetical protein A6J42_04665 [Leptospir